ncbi:hypothetical protein MSAR_24680 [Mycolicibacterium sarraceniae]|uniref:HTH-like domain-containing protein n=1 Tax=Mycolicibacterium sarraceniae TaxID=1534348 RepID=A0A7I7SQR0_9MYCO|nr:hypothetical protein MSAR_24680 [Mycolicibacterium sarraceniae]
MSRFQFVADHLHAFEVKWLCALVEVARSSFYAWLAGADGRAAREAADQVLAERIRVVHDEDNTYGAPRITAELNDGVPDGERVNHKRVARVMRSHGIAGYQRRRRVKTTVADPADQKVPDLLNRDFTATQINTRYVGDITYLPLATGGNLYLATVIDCCSRRVAGGRSPSTCAPNSSPTPCTPLPPYGAAWPVLCSMPITEVNTPQRISHDSAKLLELPSRWVVWGQVPITRSRNRSTPPSSVRSCKTGPAGPTRRVAAARCSAGWPAITPNDGTPDAVIPAPRPTKGT